VVSCADDRRLANLQLPDLSLLHVVEVGGAIPGPQIAALATKRIVVIGDYSSLNALDLDALLSGGVKSIWDSNEIIGAPVRMQWVATANDDTLVACTCGSAASPMPNGLYLFGPTGQLRQRYLMTNSGSNGPMNGPSGFRCFSVHDLDGDGRLEVIAAADDSKLYMWKPSWVD